jgi:hypothetical protein
MTLSRRHFLEMLGIAPLAFNAHKVYFDMGRSLWISPEPKVELVEVFPDWLFQLDLQQLMDKGLMAGGLLTPSEAHSLKRPYLNT